MFASVIYLLWVLAMRSDEESSQAVYERYPAAMVSLAPEPKMLNDVTAQCICDMRADKAT